MSWLNTASSIASLARSALKEAQKTIDKALDIKEISIVAGTTVTTAMVGNEETENYVSSSYAATNEASDEAALPESEFPAEEKVVFIEPSTTVTDNTNILNPTNSMWESFTESFFDYDSKKINQEFQETAPLPTCQLDSEALHFVDSRIREVNHEVSCIYEEAPNDNDSYQSLMPVSSSSTLISSEMEECLEEPKKNDESCLVSDNINSGEGEGSTSPTEALKDFSKTEASASASGDEMETTASSDIEIISSPQSGLRKQLTGQLVRISLTSHSREPSEASSEDSASTSTYWDRGKIERRLSELNQLLEARENKILESNRLCAALMTEVDELKNRLLQEEKERAIMSEAYRRQMEEFAQRLSSMDKRCQQVMAEKEALLKQLDGLRQSSDIHSNLLEQLREKEEIIQELRVEGEKLAKQQLQQSNIIKKLRAKEKEDQHQCRQLREANLEVVREVESVKKCLSAKEELERNQIEAVRQLSTANSNLEQELAANKILLRESVAEADSCHTALAQVRQKLADANAYIAAKDSAEIEHNLSTEVSLRQQLQAEFESTCRNFEDERLTLTARCQELVDTLAATDTDRSRERVQAKNELSQLMQRLQEAEARCDELSQALTIATRPLLRQIETLQNSLSAQRLAEEQSEKVLNEKLAALENRLTVANEKDSSNKDIYSSMQKRINELSEHLTVVKQDNYRLEAQLTNERERVRDLEEKKTEGEKHLFEVKSKFEGEIQVLQRKIDSLERAYDLQASSLEEENKRNATLSRLQEAFVECKSFSKDDEGKMGKLFMAELPCQLQSRSSSPTPSLEKLSISGSLTESHSSNPWISSDEVFDVELATPVPRPNLYDTMRTSSLYTAVYDNLQTQLKTRDGEVVQLQQEMYNQEKIRDDLTRELSKVISSNVELTARIEKLEILHCEHEEIKVKYNALLQMYGEKIEENEELRLDLHDIKEMYKAQIDQLMKR